VGSAYGARQAVSSAQALEKAGRTGPAAGAILLTEPDQLT
jgi:hypothetical protein